jgi:anthranilate 1,2-dioxygenase large subunit
MTEFAWPEDPIAIPDWVYTDQRIHTLEQERIFQGRTWNYVGLDCEIPEPGCWVRSFVGGLPVVLARAEDGSVHVFENRCAHRGAEFCRAWKGQDTRLACPYHQWAYDLTGELVSVPLRRGLRGVGGLPADFDMAAHSLRKLHVTTRNGTIFASFSDDVEPLEDYLGPDMLAEFDTVFDGRKLMLLGHHRNSLSGNWKLYQENLKDPYHATLLHTYLTTFGLFVAGNRTAIIGDAKGRHHALLNARPQGRPENDEAKADIASFKASMTLADPRVIEFRREHASKWSSAAMTIWPNLALIRQTNILSIRQIVPVAPDKFLLIWTSVGYAEDSPDMTAHRLRQNNIFGPGGFLGIDDHEAIKFVQDGLARSMTRDQVVPLGTDDETPEVLVTDRAIREMYRNWRSEMGL